MRSRLIHYAALAIARRASWTTTQTGATPGTYAISRRTFTAPLVSATATALSHVSHAMILISL
jgi:hypothetical protein